MGAASTPPAKNQGDEEKRVSGIRADTNAHTMDERPRESPVILITGATDGIGRETARVLVSRGASVILHGRDEVRLATVAAEIRKSAREGWVETIRADFSSLRQVRSMAHEITRRFNRLDVLLNNAGVYMKKQELTEDGLEMTFSVNHLAHFVLTLSLLTLLTQSAPSRIINVSSIAHTRAHVDLGNLQGEKKFDPYGAYAMSKLANILFTYELAERLRGKGVSVNCLHPGVVDTKLLNTGFPFSSGISRSQGAATSVYLATDPGIGNVTGSYFIGMKPAFSSALSRDGSLRKMFWKVSEGLGGIGPAGNL